ncbi:MAG TPA: extracellular solute-binding protein [Chloroflexota bacterium]|nr:extracellular solute-binding protein [Chloroflexota bacterium]
MLRRFLPGALVLILGLLQACGGAAAPAPSTATGSSVSGSNLKDLVAAANREGKVKLYINSSVFTDQWLRTFEQAFNDNFGTKIAIAGTPGGNFTSDTAKVVTEASAGQQPSWDVMFTTDAHYATLSKAGLLGNGDWVKSFGAPEKAVVFGGGGFTFSQQLVTPAYNSKLVQASDLKAWDDLLDPKWAGKIGVNTATHHWGRLSLPWGDQKTTAFIEKLAAQKPKLGATPETAQRLELGEIAIAATNTSTFVNDSQKKGAPVAAAAVEPILLVYNMAGPLKGAANPNAAALLAGFMATKKAQDLYEEASGESSVFVTGSKYNKLVEGKQFVVMTDDFLAGELDSRTAKYGKLLGFR